MLSKINYNFLLKYRNKIVSTRGGWRIGDAVYNCGYSVMEDLVGKKTFIQVLVLNATKKMPSSKLAKWIEASFICLSWPDSRIWCNQNGALVGSYGGSPVAGSVIGILSSDSKLYGPGSIVESAQFIIKAKRWQEEGLSINQIIDKELFIKKNDIVNKNEIIGYSRPIAHGDERVEALLNLMNKLDLKQGPHLKLALELHNLLAEKYNQNLSYVGCVTSFLTDQGYSPDEIYRIYTTWVHSGVNACFSESAESVKGTFLPLICDDIDYLGKTARTISE